MTKGAISEVVAGASLGIGGECYGTVRRVGSAVAAAQRVAVGDAVVAVPPDGMGSYLRTSSRWVFRADEQLAPTDAVASTMVYATAWLALHRLANIRAGHDVLIHSAAGGVGLAALALCVRAGCRVFATASTEEKRRVLLSRGTAAVFNSRSAADFAAGVRQATGGVGVDVVLNSLSGDALAASLELVKPFGSFCDVSKRDAYEGSPLSMSHFLRGVRFCPAHIDVLMLERPDDARALFDEVRGAMAELPLLPVTTYPMSQLDEALRFMASGVHIGKLVIETSDVQATLAMPRGVRIGAAGGATSSERADVLCRSVAQALRSSCESGGARADCVVLQQIPD